MTSESPDVVLYDASGNQLAVRNAAVIPSNTPAIIAAGSDGTNSRYITVDSSGRQVVIGAGVAGTPAGGVISIQGVASGTVVPVSVSGTVTVIGTVTSNQGTANTLANAWSVEVTDGNNVLGTSTHPIRTDPTGTTTQPVSGTVTANIGTTNGLALDATVSALQVSQGSTTAGQKGRLILGAVTTSAPSYTTAQTSPFSLTTSGLLRVDGSGVTQPVSGTINATQSGTWTVQPGNTANTTPWLITISQGGNSAIVTAGNALKVDGSAVTQPVSGTITANAGSGTFTVGGTVTANIGTTNGLALDASVNGILLSQGSTTSGEKGPLIQGAVTTSAPSYTTAQTSPLSLTTAGALRIDGSAVTQPVSGTVTANQGGAPWSQNITQFGGTNVSTGTGASGTGIPRVTVANDSNILATQSGSWTVTSNQGTSNTLANAWATKITDGTNTVAVKAASTPAATTDPALVVAISPNNTVNTSAVDATATGSLGALNANVQLAVQGESNAGMQLLAGTLVGTIVPEVSIDGGTTWTSTFFDDPATGNKVSSIVFASSNTATTRTIIAAGGASHVRVRVSAYTSGTATCNLRATIFNRTSLLSEGPTNSSIIPPNSTLTSGISYGVTRNQRIDRFNYTRIGYDNLLFFDVVEARSSTALNTLLWGTNTNVMTIVQNGNINGGIVLNNGLSVAVHNYAILLSSRSFQIMNSSPIKLICRAQLNQGSTNGVLEIGIGKPSAFTAAVSDGAFFRFDATQAATVVFASNGVEQSVSISPAPLTSQFYNFIIYIDENGAQFIIEDTTGVPLFSTTIKTPSANGAQFSVNRLPIFARVYNSAIAPSVAPVINIRQVSLFGMDVDTNKTWAQQLSTVARGSTLDPLSFANTTNVAAAAGPAAGTPSNTAALYTTLGGEYLCNATATSENLLSVFAYNVPSNYTFYITGIYIHPPTVQGAAVATTATNIQFAVVANCGSTNINTGGGQLFTIPGCFTAPIGAAVGSIFNGNVCLFTPVVPIACITGVLHIAYKVYLGTATASSKYRGSVYVDGFFE